MNRLNLSIHHFTHGGGWARSQKFAQGKIAEKGIFSADHK